MGNVGDKYFLSHWFSNPYIYAALPFLFSIFGVGAIFFTDFYFLDNAETLLVASGALMFVVASFIYSKALFKEEVSRIAILLDFVSPITLILAWYFIGEKLTAWQLAAFALMFAGSFAASLKISSQKIRLSIAWLYIFFACLLYAGHDVILRYLTSVRHESPAVVFIYLSFFLALVSYFCFFSRSFRLELRANLKKLNAGALFLVVLLVIGYRVAVYFYTRAVALGPVALINAFQGFQTIISFGLVLAITKFHPNIIKEDLSLSNLVAKLAGLVLMAGGVALLYLV